MPSHAVHFEPTSPDWLATLIWLSIALLGLVLAYVAYRHSPWRRVTR